MAMSSILHHLIFSFLISLLLISFCYNVHGRHSEDRNFRYFMVNVSSLIPSTTCSSPIHSNNTNSNNHLKITHRYGPCSPFAGGHNFKLSLGDILHYDKVRMSLHNRRFLNSTSFGSQLKSSTRTSDPLWSGNPFDYSGGYLVTVGLGTPSLDQNLILDTGSDVTWVQCKPCAVSCHDQLDSVFDPSASSSYRPIACGTRACRRLDKSNCTTDNTCVYEVTYYDGSHTVGYLSQDTLTLAPTNVFPKFVFGCGQNNTGILGETAGLLGLARASLSFVSQTSRQLGEVFSYCLPTSCSSIGHLRFGSQATNHETPMSYTPMLTSSYDSFYYLELTGISVGGRLLNIPPKKFAATGTIIDSGTTFTYLPKSAYRKLRSAFRRGMSDYKRIPSPFDSLDTCYDFTGMEYVRVPTVVLHFGGGAKIDLTGAGIFRAENIKEVCLAFAEKEDDTDVNILGIVQQQSMEVVYDLRMERIGFGPGAC